MSDHATLAVIGAGSFGSTLATLLHDNGHRIRLLCHTPAERDALSTSRHPHGVPNLRLPQIEMLTADAAEALQGADAAVMVVPSQAMSALCRTLSERGLLPPLLVIASKGIDLKTLRPMSDVVGDCAPSSTVAVVSGPCIAREVAAGVPTSVVAASADPAAAERVQMWFNSPRFRVYRQKDVMGVELGGALKNVIAIAAGISDGMGFGANSKAALLTRGLAEMMRLAVHLGAKELTISGLAGLGDLCVTCFSEHSRNRRFGEALGRGGTPAEIIEQIGEVVEGVPTAEAAVKIAQEAGFHVPIAEVVVNIVSGKWTPESALEQLMGRELKPEFE